MWWCVACNLFTACSRPYSTFGASPQPLVSGLLSCSQHHGHETRHRFPCCLRVLSDWYEVKYYAVGRNQDIYASEVQTPGDDEASTMIDEACPMTEMDHFRRQKYLLQHSGMQGVVPGLGKTNFSYISSTAPLCVLWCLIMSVSVLSLNMSIVSV